MLEFPGLCLEIEPQRPNVYLTVTGSIGVKSFFTKRQGCFVGQAIESKMCRHGRIQERHPG